ncbi:MAG TPA: MOSC domain-containing protein [Rubrobacteraceae bacterium]|nr:MOSC domain-containing protein [Rubrobacteraceae bacterium]
MRLLSVNLGRGRAIPRAGKPRKTGIYKLPADGAVRVTAEGLEGDEILDRENHGGVDQAVYVYGAPDYEWWSEALDRELRPGAFGENLTISGLRSADALIGDRLLIGSAILEVTAPRIPCVTLATRMDDPAFLKRFRTAERPGVYCRVIREGEVRVGDAVSYQGYQGDAVSAVEMFRDFFEPDLSEPTIRRHLDAPIAMRARIDLERRLTKFLDRSVKSG